MNNLNTKLINNKDSIKKYSKIFKSKKKKLTTINNQNKLSKLK